MIDQLPTPDWKSECGDVALYCGDCLDLLPQIPEGVVDMIWTDPPYGHGNAQKDFMSHRHNIMRDQRGFTQEAIDNDLPDEMRIVVDGVLQEAARIMNKDCCCCCCCCCGGGPSPTFAWIAQRMDTGGLSFFHSVIWDKKNPGIGWRYRRQHEMVMVCHRRGGRLLWARESRKQPNIISISKPRADLHPNEKPVELVELFIKNHAPIGSIILDPFMGSGTTGVACVQLGRRFIGIEIRPQYFEIAKERIQRAIEDREGQFLTPQAEAKQEAFV